MYKKILPILFVVLIVFSGVQPIFADTPKLGDTKIGLIKFEPLKDIRAHPGREIQLYACLYSYCSISYYVWNLPVYKKPEWNYQHWRCLDFYVYRSNPDGSNADLVWSDTALTGFYSGKAAPDKFSLSEKGTYNLVVKYEGNLNKHCDATAKIYIK
jgi:hypothetical protein